MESQGRSGDRVSQAVVGQTALLLASGSIAWIPQLSVLLLLLNCADSVL